MVLFLLTVGFTNRALASHYAAADLYLDYIGNDTSNTADGVYRVTLIIYKACEWGPNGTAIDLSPTEYVNFASSCVPGFSWGILGGPPDTLDQLCPNFAPVNTCRTYDSPWPAFVRKVYDTIVTLPPCTDWEISWSSGSRNAGIQNLVNPSGQNIYVSATLNNAFRLVNNTPRFLADPIPYICVNQYSLFLNNPFDPDNDSIRTSNEQPLNTGPGAPIPYAGGFSLSNPVASSTSNPYSVSPTTGVASFTPTLQGKFVLAFQAKEYDRATGTELSSVRRDVQVAILDCQAGPPSIDSTPQSLTGAGLVTLNTGEKYVVGCPGVPMTFDVHSQSNSMSNTVYMVANNALTIPGSSFTVSNQGTNIPVGTFSWTPPTTGDFTLIVTAKDSTCDNGQPLVLKSYFVVYIRIVTGIAAGPDGQVCKLEPIPYQLSVTGPEGVRYRWTALDGSAALWLNNDTITNPLASPPNTFTYVVTAPQLACNNRDTVTVSIDTANAVKVVPNDAVVCRPGYFELQAHGVGLAPLRNLMCGTYDTLACAVQDTVIMSTDFSGAAPFQSSVYTPFQTNRTARMQFLITKDDLKSFGLRSSTIRGLAFKIASPSTLPYNNFSISLKCSDKNALTASTGGMEDGATLVYTSTAPVTTATNGWKQFNFDRPYSLDSTKALLVEICYNNVINFPNGAQVDAVNTASQQMAIMSSNTGTASICQNTTAPVTYYTGRPIIRFNFCPADTVPFEFTWTPGDFLSDSTAQSPLAYVKNSTKYVVTTHGRNGCKVQDSILITVPVHDYDVWPKDTSFCLGGSFLMKALGGYDHVKWYEGDENNFQAATSLNCDDCREPIGTPEKDTKYFAVMTDVHGCSDTMMVNAVVRPLPNVHILNNDTTIKYGQSIQLLVSGAYLYSWQPLSTISNPNVVNPYASPTEPTTYYVYGIGDNGCRNLDSVHVNIDYRDNLFVPSAFSPNGDGKNDVFHVSNITFQKLQEFRVFNRWGQEIYSTTDPKKGWDGTWKGVQQDMGTYQYLIRVAYPDGYIETYKGDVTLVR
jgi:gliding motility-associated-like protein